MSLQMNREVLITTAIAGAGRTAKGGAAVVREKLELVKMARKG